jgi:hypothetical protein
MSATSVALSATDTELVEVLTREIGAVLLVSHASRMLSKFTLKIAIGAHDDFASPSVREAVEEAVLANFTANPGRLFSVHIHRPSFEDDGGPAGERPRRVVRVTVKTPRDLA